MDEFWDVAIPLIALFGSMALAAVLLTRARSHAKPEQPEGQVQVPASASKRQRRILNTLEPTPEIPTLMDLVREEVADLGLAEIPGSEGLSDGVLLKVYRRDALVRERCTHDGYEYGVTEGVDRGDAGDEDVWLFCEKCGESGTKPDEDSLD